MQVVKLKECKKKKCPFKIPFTNEVIITLKKGGNIGYLARLFTLQALTSSRFIVFDMLTLGKENSSRTMIVLTPHNIDIGKENLDLDRIDSFDPHKTLTLVKKT